MWILHPHPLVTTTSTNPILRFFCNLPALYIFPVFLFQLPLFLLSSTQFRLNQTKSRQCSAAVERWSRDIRFFPFTTKTANDLEPYKRPSVHYSLVFHGRIIPQCLSIVFCNNFLFFIRFKTLSYSRTLFFFLLSFCVVQKFIFNSHTWGKTFFFCRM